MDLHIYRIENSGFGATMRQRQWEIKGLTLFSSAFNSVEGVLVGEILMLVELIMERGGSNCNFGNSPVEAGLFIKTD